ncbi:uncharacterized protein LOC135845424 [Planococcus citri]|uniref:uncharacterized protein LOC135845424 n=1 Tax=Planococcus citri TaxID=170843 RepID=UPI0031F97BBA
MKRSFRMIDCSALCSKLEELRLEHDRGIETRSSIGFGFGDCYDSVLAKLRGTPGEEIAPGLILRHVVDFTFNEFGLDLLEKPLNETQSSDLSMFRLIYRFRKEWLKNEYSFLVSIVADEMLDFIICAGRRNIGELNAEEPKPKRKKNGLKYKFAHLFVLRSELPSFEAFERDADENKITSLITEIIEQFRKLWTLKQEPSEGSSDSESTSSSTDEDEDED